MNESGRSKLPAGEQKVAGKGSGDLRASLLFILFQLIKEQFIFL